MHVTELRLLYLPERFGSCFTSCRVRNDSLQDLCRTGGHDAEQTLVVVLPGLDAPEK